MWGNQKVPEVSNIGNAMLALQTVSLILAKGSELAAPSAVAGPMWSMVRSFAAEGIDILRSKFKFVPPCSKLAEKWGYKRSRNSLKHKFSRYKTSPAGAAHWEQLLRQSPQAAAAAPRSTAASSQWIRGKMLGSGTFGQVFQGFNSESGQFCAIKEVKVAMDDAQSKERLKQLNQEIDILRELQHPNIVQYHGSELTDDTLRVHLEYVSGGSIQMLLSEYGAFKEPLIRKYAGQILAGLAYLHGRNTVHRDIKGANVLVGHNGEVKLADFSVSKHISPYAEVHSFKGTPHWMAPEVVINSHGYDLSVDIWSFGCTIIEMATARPPWHPCEKAAAMFKIASSKEIPAIPNTFSEEGKNFLQLCLKRDPASRASAAQLMDHPYVRDHPEDRKLPSSKKDMGPSKTSSQHT